jgi:hypothetical protein
MPALPAARRSPLTFARRIGAPESSGRELETHACSSREYRTRMPTCLLREEDHKTIPRNSEIPRSRQQLSRNVLPTKRTPALPGSAGVSPAAIPDPNTTPDYATHADQGSDQRGSAGSPESRVSTNHPAAEPFSPAISAKASGSWERGRLACGNSRSKRHSGLRHTRRPRLLPAGERQLPPIPRESNHSAPRAGMAPLRRLC